MIIEAILNIFKSALIWLIGLVPAPEISLGLGAVVNSFIEMLQVASYFLPVGDILVMFQIWFSIYTFSIVWKLIQRLWDALPFV